MQAPVLMLAWTRATLAPLSVRERQWRDADEAETAARIERHCATDAVLALVGAVPRDADGQLLCLRFASLAALEAAVVQRATADFELFTMHKHAWRPTGLRLDLLVACIDRFGILIGFLDDGEHFKPFVLCS